MVIGHAIDEFGFEEWDQSFYDELHLYEIDQAEELRSAQAVRQSGTEIII